MIFDDTGIAGVYLLKLEPHVDERGFFARSFDASEFSSRGLCTSFPQCSYSYNRKRGTLRGMHYQVAPYEEVKIVTCVKGSIFDVALDIREGSATYGKWVGVELSEANNYMLYIPAGLAHGFQTLADDSMVYYQMGAVYSKEAGRTLGYDDERFDIKWPLAEKILSAKDRSAARG